MAIANPEALNSIVPIQAGGFGGGPTPGGAAPWSVIRPTNNDRWSTDYYSTGDPILRGNDQVRFTAGVVHLVRRASLTSSGPEIGRSLLSCVGPGLTGYLMQQSAGVFPTTLRSRYVAQVAGTAVLSDGHFPGEAIESSNTSHLQLTALVVSDEVYAGEDAFYIQGNKQLAAPVWTPSNTPFPLRLGTTSGGDSLASIEDWFVGWFYHLEAMTNRELWGLLQNIMLAGKIPDTDMIGGGTVPDYIFDVATQMPVPGTDAAPAIWVSGGATGGLTMTKTGSIDVVNVNPRAFGSRG